MMQSWIALLLVQIGYAFTYPIASDILHSGLSPLTWAALRCLLTGFILGVWTWIQGKPLFPKVISKMEWFLLSALAVSANQFCFISALAHSTATETALLVTTIPVFVYAATVVLRIERFRVRRGIGLLLAVLAVYWLKNASTSSLNVFHILNAVVYGSYLIRARHLMKQLKGVELITPLFVLGGLTLGLIWGLSEFSNHQSSVLIDTLRSSLLWTKIFIVVTAGTIFPYIWNVVAAKKLSSSTVAIAITLQPLFTALFESLKDHRLPPSELFFPASLLLGGVILAALPPKNRQV
jgi:drug/metabolite transporter (DMT)-like permease